VTLSAGLINIPLSVFTATETTAVTRKEFLNGDPNIPVGRAPIRKDTEAIVHTADVTRMVEADNGTWVTLTDDEVAGCVGAPGGCEVVSFVPVKDAGRYLTDGLYQVRPKVDKRGGAAATAAFSLLLAGMAARKVHALVRITMRGTPRYGLLTVEGDLLMIATADNVREALPLPDHKPSKAEVTMVCSLIDAIGIESPTVVDDASPKVRAFVNEKAGPGNVTAIKSAAPLSAPVDLTEMLTASIEAAKAAKKKVAA
jgi:DNA end-binding protein Ku